jgi:hypothetical protein
MPMTIHISTFHITYRVVTTGFKILISDTICNAFRARIVVSPQHQLLYLLWLHWYFLNLSLYSLRNMHICVCISIQLIIYMRLVKPLTQQQQFKTQQIYGFCPIGSHHISNHILIKNRAIIIRKITDHGRRK